MPKISKDNAEQIEKMEGFEGHYQEVDGYTIGFEKYTKDVDLSPLFKRLPNDQCQSQHWGYVIKGKLIYKYADGNQDEINAGEAYYVRPGHTPILTAGTEVVEFSPTDKLKETMEMVTKNMRDQK